MANPDKPVSPARNDNCTAAEAYAARRNDVARLLDVLNMHLLVNAEGSKANPTD